MLKLFTFAIIFAVAALQATSQLSAINTFNQQKIRIEKNSLIAIAAWGATNIIYNGITAGSYQGSEKCFRQMNVLWGGVNFSLGVLGYLFIRKKPVSGFSSILKKQVAIENIYLLNTGLDVAYIAGGFYLKERSVNRAQNSARNKGFGESIILQGTALFFYDGLMSFIHAVHGKKLYKILGTLQVGINENGLGCSLLIR